MKTRNPFKFWLLIFLGLGMSVSSYAQSEWPKGVLVEHFTATWCGICTEGYQMMDQAIGPYPDIVEVFLHVSDPMENSHTLEVGTVYAPGFPTAMGDRFLFPTMGQVAVDRFDYNLIPQRLNEPAKVALFGSNTYDQQTRQLNVNLGAMFNQYHEADLRFNCYVVEDKVTGNGSYSQSNGDNNFQGSPYFGLGDPIVGFEHRNVVRHMLGGAWGTDLVMPDTVQAWDQYSTSYQYTLPSSWDDSEVFLVLMVQEHHFNPNKREILNILKMDLNSQVGAPVGIEKAQKDENPLEVLQGHAQTSLYIESVSGPATIEVFNLAGQLVWSKNEALGQGSTLQVPLPSAAWDSGIYLVRVSDPQSTWQEKIFLD